MYYRQNERRGQKQNGLDSESFKLKTRQYSNYIASPIAQKNSESNRQIQESNKSINMLLNSYNISDSFQKPQKLSIKPRANDGDKRQSPKPLGISNNYRPDRSEMGRYMKPGPTQSYDYRGYIAKENITRSPIQKDYIQNSFSQINNKIGDTISSSQSFKKDNARQKGFQIKMNNIDSISDQINSLLNMVKKDRSNYDHSTSKSPAKVRQTSTIRNQSSKPVTSYRVSQFDPKDRQIDRKYEFESYHNETDQQRRTRVYSALESKEINYTNKNKYYQQGSFQKKQSERLSNYSNSNKLQQNETRMKYQQHLENKEIALKNLQNNSYRPTLSPKNIEKNSNRYDPYSKERQLTPNSQHLKGRTAQKYYQQKMNEDSLNSPNIQQSNSWKFQQDESYKQKKQLAQYTPKYKKYGQTEKNDNYYLPLTLQQPKQQPSTKSYQNYAIDEQIKRIKDKIKQSQNDNNKMQQKYQNIQQNCNVQNNYDRNGASNYDQMAGRLYRKNSISPAKPFEIKIHPVQIDKPNTINIAEKLGKQIEIDKQLKIHRSIFSTQIDQSKWEYLEQSLREKGVAISSFQLRFLIEMSKRQLESARPKESFKTDKDIVDIIYNAQKHWEREVYGCANAKSLDNENFKIQSLDTLRKGYLSHEDIVQFVNQYTGKFYRQEDVTLIFRRLQLLEGNRNEEKLKYGTFLKAIAL